MTPPARKRSATAIFRAVRPPQGAPDTPSPALGQPRPSDAAEVTILSRWTVWIVSALLVAVLGFLAARWATHGGAIAGSPPTLRLGVDGVLSVDEEEHEGAHPAE